MRLGDQLVDMTGIIHADKVIIWKCNDKGIRTASEEEIFFQKRDGTIPHVTTHVGKLIMLVKIRNALFDRSKLHHSIVAAAAIVAALSLCVHQVGKIPCIAIDRNLKTMEGIILNGCKAEWETWVGDIVGHTVLCKCKTNFLARAVCQLKIVGSVFVLQHLDHKLIVFGGFAILCGVSLGRLVDNRDVILVCLDLLERIIFCLRGKHPLQTIQQNIVVHRIDGKEGGNDQNDTACSDDPVLDENLSHA